MTTQVLVCIKPVDLAFRIINLLKEKKKLKDGALRTAANALNDTYLYCRYLKVFSKRDFRKETRLAKYWSTTAIQMRHIDKKFATICDKMSEYWVNPDNHTKKDVSDFGIGLKSVRQAYRKILN
jgi:hypothetical protein